MASDTTDPAPRELREGELTGLVIGSGRGGDWDVAVAGEILACRLRGRLKTAPGDRLGHLVVGDNVVVARSTEHPERGSIEEVLPRRSRVGRGRVGKGPQLIAANLDQLAVVVSTHEPELSLHALDRFLCLASVEDVDSLVVLNKCDLDDGGLQDEVTAIYGPLGIPVLCTSAETGKGLGKLDDTLAGRITAVVGPSGAGKSSLLNALNPGYALRTGEVMSIGKGRHTTTETRLLALDRGGYVADTPGIKTLQLIAEETEPLALQHLFPELDHRFGTCQFSNCAHRDEPGCRIAADVEAGLIAESRYDSYLRLYDELEAAWKPW